MSFLLDSPELPGRGSPVHRGAFAVFAYPLKPSLETATVEGSYASAIGGAPPQQ